MKFYGFIPARYESSRFPGKILADIKGKSMIRRVVEQAEKVKAFEKIVVATDHEAIAKEVNSFGGEVVMTSTLHQNGTSRCYEAAQKICHRKDDIIINIQGDEPFIFPEQIEQLISLFQKNQAISIGTLAKKIKTTTQLFDPNAVKVIFDKNQRALYFSRSVIPFVSGKKQDNWVQQFNYFEHVGLYGYTFEQLGKISQLPNLALENMERLEQLNWLENGLPIHVEFTEYESFCIDTPEDLENALRRV